MQTSSFSLEATNVHLYLCKSVNKPANVHTHPQYIDDDVGGVVVAASAAIAVVCCCIHTMAEAHVGISKSFMCFSIFARSLMKQRDILA